MAATARAVMVGTPVPATAPGAGWWVGRVAMVLAIAALLGALGASWFAVEAGTDYPDPAIVVTG